ncbi:E3 ubiquitin-protein ligase ATL59 [Bienertia sinuspersici]
MTSGKTNLVMTVIGFVVSTLFIVFICTRLICARIQLRNSRRNFRRHIDSRSNLSALEGGMHGVQSPISAKFPAKEYGDEYFSSESGQCSICLAEYHKEDVLRIIPYCGHYFHIKCIDLWLLQHCTCPVCRLSLRETNERKRFMQLMSSSRSHLNTDILAVSPRGCRYMSRTPETHVTDPVQEDQLLSHVVTEASGENYTQPEEDDSVKNPKKKRVESPSFA